MIGATSAIRSKPSGGIALLPVPFKQPMPTPSLVGNLELDVAFGSKFTNLIFHGDRKKFSPHHIARLCPFGFRMRHTGTNLFMNYPTLKFRKDIASPWSAGCPRMKAVELAVEL